MKNQLEKLLQQATQKKNELDSYRPLPKELIKNLDQWFKVETTYTSNAIEGNTLTAIETAIVIEKGLTIAGKTVKEHLEAINHGFAFDYILSLAKQSKDEIKLDTIFDLHSLVLKGIDNENAGCLRRIQVKISGSKVLLPQPIKLPDLMNDFIAWLHTTREHPIIIAAEAHLELVTIHPFVDGNGRTARLLMNLLLIQEGYPPTIIRP